MAALTNKQKKDWAKLLFLKENLTQKEIAERVGVTEKTISNWVNDKKENWEMLKSSVIVTKSEELRRIYMQINELNTFIATREPGQRFANSKEADSLNKLAATVRALETDVAIADVIEVFKRFTEWLRAVDLDKAKDVIRLEDDFIKHLLK
ncbi:MAG: DDE transposase family protein [Bacteroidetes bacterium HGW-Bacteroidetes-4]|jgi:transcriptional regulator with XRE-family HTH domain|nr:MAG: DDE transposase family protein [Bacteroidetes bacterium HGW-Bacteroidetes-4]